MPTDRTTFLIDGFNLYHSVIEASNDLHGASTKWLNIRALCESYLYTFGPDNVTEELYYFSALAHHMTAKDPSTVARHLAFIDCLKSTGFEVELARFKEKWVWCDGCKQKRLRHEEKETDVALAVKLIELFCERKCDTAVIMTGDTDIAPAVRFVKRYYPTKRVGFLFPYGRKNTELAKLALSRKITKEQYLKHQFPPTVTLADGSIRTKPTKW
jgi:uncharacterized LabA/DUF88 family protein